MELVKAAVTIGAAACVGAILAAWSFERRATETASPQPPTQTRTALAKPAASPAPDASSPRRATGSGDVIIPSGPGGHFHAQVEVAGRRLPMVVDTGATVIALTAEDARAIGVQTFPADYTANVSTANGVLKAAPTRLNEVRIGGIVAYDVQALVMPRGALGQSLLGMSFLRKLRAFEISDGRLVMRP